MGKFTKHAQGKKTDVKDSRWIQKLHALGLLTSSFLPDEITEQLRTYCRQRTNWLNLAAEASSKMQKYLKLLNFRLDVVVRDVCAARKLAVIIWNMQVKKVPYLTDKEYMFLDQKRHLRLVTRIRKQITKFDIKPDQLGFSTN